jgi:biopolymer transport protein ExbB
LALAAALICPTVSFGSPPASPVHLAQAAAPAEGTVTNPLLAPPEQRTPPPVAPAKMDDHAATGAPTSAAATPTVGDGSSRPSVSIAAPIPHDLSPWSMFLSADIIVKAVMIGLTFASLLTWTIFLAKIFEFALMRRKLQRALNRVEQCRFLSEAKLALGARRNALASFVAAAVREIGLSSDFVNEAGIKERASSRFAEIVRGEARAVRRGMGLLATIGSTGPFVGLFGTVWGIMNSFIGISKSQTTNLAVVAPGIAEALLATAFGLAAAIPAVVIYNYFTRSSRKYLDLVARASGVAERLLSRDLDRGYSSSISHAAE